MIVKYQTGKDRKMVSASFDPHEFRNMFPYFRSNESSICFDCVGGTQVPDSVVTAIQQQISFQNGNRGGVFGRSVRTMELMDSARQTIADFLNAPEADEVILDANFTTLTFAISRAIARTWSAGDEIVVSRLDHDSNVSPWVRAADDVGAIVKYWDIEDGTCQLTVEGLLSQLSSKTRLVAFCAASSSVGTRPDVKTLIAHCRNAGALTYVDAVAYAPHAPIDVQDWNADFVGCSAYKFFGPHMSFVWGRRELLEQIDAYKVRPAPNTLPIKWVNGAQPYELAAGVKAAIEYLANIGKRHSHYARRFPGFRGAKLDIHLGMAAIEAYEAELTWHFIEAVKERPAYRIWGIAEKNLASQRIPPIAVSLPGIKPNDLAIFLSESGIDVWSRSVYSISLSERLGLEGVDNPQNVGGFIRVGFCHYNTVDEVDRLLVKLDEFASLSERSIRRAV